MFLENKWSESFFCNEIDKNLNKICLLCNDKYIKYAFVTMKSILEKCNDDYEFIILCEWCSKKNKKLLKKFAKKNKTHINFVDICDYKIKNKRANVIWPDIVYKKIIVQDSYFKHCKKLLLLDLDILICQNIDDIFSKCENNYISMTWDLTIMTYNLRNLFIDWKYDNKIKTFGDYFKKLGLFNYYNSGVVLINNKWWKEHADGSLELYYYPDQDYLNHTYNKKIHNFGYQYNFHMHVLEDSNFLKSKHFISKEVEEDIIKAKDEIKMIHSLYIKPWDFRCNINQEHRKDWRRISFKTRGYRFYFKIKYIIAFFIRGLQYLYKKLEK